MSFKLVFGPPAHELTFTPIQIGLGAPVGTKIGQLSTPFPNPTFSLPTLSPSGCFSLDASGGVYAAQAIASGMSGVARVDFANGEFSGISITPAVVATTPWDPSFETEYFPRWLRADLAATVSGNELKYLTSQGSDPTVQGHGPSAAGPLYVTSGIGGLPTLQFATGSNSFYIENGSGATPSSGNNATAMAGHSRITAMTTFQTSTLPASGNYAYFFADTTAGTTNTSRFMARMNSNGTITAISRPNDADGANIQQLATSTKSYADGNPHVLVIDSKAGFLQIIVDGVVDGTATGSDTGPYSSAAAGSVYWGSIGGISPLVGESNEYLIGVDCTDDIVQRLTGYAMWRNGLQAKLATNGYSGPYAQAAPLVTSHTLTLTSGQASVQVGVPYYFQVQGQLTGHGEALAITGFEGSVASYDAPSGYWSIVFTAVPAQGVHAMSYSETVTGLVPNTGTFDVNVVAAQAASSYTINAARA